MGIFLYRGLRTWTARSVWVAGALGVVVVAGCGSSDGDAGQTQTPETAVADPGAEVAPGERIEFDGEGVKLVGTFWRGTTRPADGVVLLHQLSSERSEWGPVIDALRPLGVSILSVDLRGHGESVANPAAEGPAAIVLWRQFENVDWAKLPDDAERAIEFARSRGVTKFVLGGSSIGSSAALVAGARREDVVGVFALSPGRDYRGLETLPAAEAFGARRLLAVAAEGEAPAKETADALAAAVTTGRTHIVPGSHHGLRMLGEAPDLPQVLAAFVGEVLP